MASAEVVEKVELLENRINELESRNLFQDDVIDQLNEELAVHQTLIAEMQGQLKLMATRIKEASSGQGVNQGTELPPHF
jgi:SlyX protein